MLSAGLLPLGSVPIAANALRGSSYPTHFAKIFSFILRQNRDRKNGTNGLDATRQPESQQLLAMAIQSGVDVLFSPNVTEGYFGVRLLDHLKFPIHPTGQL